MFNDKLTHGQRIRLEAFAQSVQMAAARLIQPQAIFDNAQEIERFLLAAKEPLECGKP